MTDSSCHSDHAARGHAYRLKLRSKGNDSGAGTLLHYPTSICTHMEQYGSNIMWMHVQAEAELAVEDKTTQKTTNTVDDCGSQTASQKTKQKG